MGAAFEPVIRPSAAVCHGENEDLVFNDLKDHHIFESKNQSSTNIESIRSRFQLGEGQRIVSDSFEVSPYLGEKIVTKARAAPFVIANCGLNLFIGFRVNDQVHFRRSEEHTSELQSR